LLSLETHRGNREAIREGSYDRFLYNFYRTYDPNTGRYLEADPIGQDGGINLYSYALDSPLNAPDPLGLDPEIPHPQSPYIVFYEPDFTDKTNPGVYCPLGGIRVYIPKFLYDTNAAKCGVLDCYREHESLHARDFEVTHPRPCSGAPKNWVPAFRSKSLQSTSEIRAYSAELNCLKDKLTKARDCECRELIEDEIATAKERREEYGAGEVR
jgi:RHS repeat-associated protein